jgi:predicted nucleotidyltransferase
MDRLQAIVDRILNELPSSAALYSYGSIVYGTTDEASDFDFQVIVSDKDVELTKKKLNQINKGYIDLHLHSLSDFLLAIEAAEPYAIECLFLPKEYVYRDSFSNQFMEKYHSVKKTTIRSSFSEKASNAWVKGKKKLIVDKDYNERIAIKSIFHSFRLYEFGIQLGLLGKIENYKAVNNILLDLKSIEDKSWDSINKMFKLKNNEASTVFKQALPK